MLFAKSQAHHLSATGNARLPSQKTAISHAFLSPFLAFLAMRQGFVALETATSTVVARLSAFHSQGVAMRKSGKRRLLKAKTCISRIQAMKAVRFVAKSSRPDLKSPDKGLSIPPRTRMNRRSFSAVQSGRKSVRSVWLRGPSRQDISDRAALGSPTSPTETPLSLQTTQHLHSSSHLIGRQD